VYEVLHLLAAHGGRSVSSDELCQAWRGKRVDRHTVGVTISDLRKVLGDCGSWIQYDRNTGFSLRIPLSDSLIRHGDHFLGNCSRDGVGHALNTFSEAVAIAPEDHRGFQGQANCYLLLSAFGLRPGWQLAPLFRNAHQRATALVGSTPTLRCQSAQGLLFYEHRVTDSLAEFRRITDVEPSLTTARVCQALVLAATGDLDAAKAATQAALAIDPLSPTAATSDLSVSIWRGETELAVGLGARVVELHPFFAPARIYYGMALELSGDPTHALDEYRTASLFMQQLPWAVSLEAACLAKTGRVNDARRILDDLKSRRRTEYVDPYALARIQLALGSPDEAFDALSQAVADDVGYLHTIAVDPLVEGFRRDPRFNSLLRQWQRETSRTRGV
jgi:tetratricopeptide (TPR) repeat protein